MEKLEDQVKLDGDLHEGMLGHLDFEVTNLYQRVTDLEGGEPSFNLDSDE